MENRVTKKFFKNIFDKKISSKKISTEKQFRPIKKIVKINFCQKNLLKKNLTILVFAMASKSVDP